MCKNIYLEEIIYCNGKFNSTYKLKFKAEHSHTQADNMWKLRLGRKKIIKLQRIQIKNHRRKKIASCHV